VNSIEPRPQHVGVSPVEWGTPTLYSQIRKHNVSWPEFANELEELRQEYVQEI
jgi:hypothetical protein